MRGVTCEGGPHLLRELIVQDCLDDLVITVAPLLVGGDALMTLAGQPLGEIAPHGPRGRAPRRRPRLPALPHAAMTVLRLRDRTVEIERGRPLVMGIVNANPDSFSDRIRLGTLKEQIAQRARRWSSRAPTSSTSAGRAA